MSETPQHVLVTGGAGFIGSHTVDALRAAGVAVTVLDDLSTGRRGNLAAHDGDPRCRLVVGDVCAPPDDALDACAAALGPFTGVIHLAAQVSVQRSIADPHSDMRTNLGGTYTMLAWARARGVARLVFASSAAVYGDGPLPADEASPCAPLSPYGVHKLAAEHHLRNALGVDTASCRFFNVFGPRQVPGSEYAGVIAIFLERALAGRPIGIHGDGSATRDFVYVGDVARALATALAAPGPLAGRALNVGTGRETTILELATAARAVTGSASTIAHGPARPGDVARSVALVDRLRALAWAPTIMLDDGLAATARWLATST